MKSRILKVALPQADIAIVIALAGGCRSTGSGGSPRRNPIGVFDSGIGGLSVLEQPLGAEASPPRQPGSSRHQKAMLRFTLVGAHV